MSEKLYDFFLISGDIIIGVFVKKNWFLMGWSLLKFMGFFWGIIFFFVNI